MNHIYAQTYRSAARATFGDLGTPLPWMDDADCLRTDPEEFFPTTGHSAGQAIRVCRNCPVLAQCQDYAMARPDLGGVWGGMSERARRDERARRLRNENVA